MVAHSLPIMFQAGFEGFIGKRKYRIIEKKLRTFTIKKAVLVQSA